MPARRTYNRVTARAPAKLNLHLQVGRRREDGYHDLTTVFHAVSVTDRVRLTRAPSLSITVEGTGAADVPCDDTNLAGRAIQAVAARTGQQCSVAIHITKAIPVAGGCAGGSADAAAALVATDVLLGTGLSRQELAELAAGLGSDVPFCLHGGTALGTGRGEQLTPVLGHGSYSWVLAVADGGLSTPAVYGELDRQRDTGPVRVVSDASDVLGALRRGDPVLLGRALANDLQAAAVALRPALRDVLDAARQLGAVGVIVSGSGPTVAALARDAAAADALAEGLLTRGVAAHVLRADGPVGGAAVVEAS